MIILNASVYATCEATAVYDSLVISIGKAFKIYGLDKDYLIS